MECGSLYPAGMDGQQLAFLKRLENVFLWTLSLEERLFLFDLRFSCVS